MTDLDAPMNAVALGHVLAARMPEVSPSEKPRLVHAKPDLAEGISAKKREKAIILIYSKPLRH
ncbi:MAG: hypothetical protein KBC46_00560 [Ferrovibrio sp.]|nr:hypothetical protein [Ferrovibrio sp.]